MEIKKTIISLVVGVSCLYALQGYSRAQGRGTKARSETQKSGATKDSPAPPASPNRSAYAVNSHYDEFKDQTYVSVGPMKLSTATSSRSIEMDAVFSYPGKTLVKAPDSAMVRFSTQSVPGNFSNFEDGPEWLVIIDGVREKFGKMRYEISKNVVIPGLVTEELTMLTTRDGIEKLAKGSVVRMSVGGIECTFAPEQQKELKRFAEKMIEGLGDVSPSLEVLDWTWKAAASRVVRAKLNVRNPTNADISLAVAVITCTTFTGARFTEKSDLETVPAASSIVTELLESFDTDERFERCDLTFETLLDHKPIKTVFLHK